MCCGHFGTRSAARHTPSVCRSPWLAKSLFVCSFLLPLQVLAIEPAPGEETADCWAVALGNAPDPAEYGSLASGYDNGDVKLFDMRAANLQWDTNVDFGVCHLQFDRKDIAMNKLAISCLEGQLFMADMRTFHPEDGYTRKAQKLSESQP